MQGKSNLPLLFFIMSDMEQLLINYRDSLFWFCAYNAQLQQFGEAIEQNQEINKKRLIYAAVMLEHYKSYLLEDKKALGFDDGLDFLENNRFIGFEIKEGKFIGDKDKVLDIVAKWRDGFPQKANNYQYEVAMLCLTLAFPEVLKDLYPSKYNDEPLAA